METRITRQSRSYTCSNLVIIEFVVPRMVDAWMTPFIFREGPNFRFNPEYSMILFVPPIITRSSRGSERYRDFDR